MNPAPANPPLKEPTDSEKEDAKISQFGAVQSLRDRFEPGDLRFVSDPASAGFGKVELRHRACNQIVGYAQHPTDPDASNYYCARNLIMRGMWYNPCPWTAKRRELLNLPVSSLRELFSVNLIPDAANFPIWKVVDGNGFTYTKLCTAEEAKDAYRRALRYLRCSR